MFDDTVLHGMAKFVKSSFALLQFLVDIGVELICGAGDDDVVFGSSDSG